MLPVFSLVLDEDVPSDIALIYPELYKDLGKVGDETNGVVVVSLNSIFVGLNVSFPLF